MIEDHCKFNFALQPLAQSEWLKGCLSGYTVVLSGIAVGQVYWQEGGEWLVTRLDGSFVEGKGHMQPCGSERTQRGAVAKLVEALAKEFTCSSKSSPTR